jgi:hypothetical protein
MAKAADKDKDKNKRPKRAISIGDTAMAMALEPGDKVELSDGFDIEINGLHVIGQPAFESWEQGLKRLRIYERGAQFAVGDALLYGEDRYGEQAAQAVDPSLGWSPETLNVYRWVARSIPREIRRMDRIGIAHHMLVAKADLSPSKKKHWLDKASADGEERAWTLARLRDALKAGEDLPPSAFVVIVYCDSEAKRDKLRDKLEADGYETKTGERRKPKAAV